jgi:hypothetical protein
MVNNFAFVGQKNFDIIEMHGATTKINENPYITKVANDWR